MSFSYKSRQFEGFSVFSWTNYVLFLYFLLLQASHNGSMSSFLCHSVLLRLWSTIHLSPLKSCIPNDARFTNVYLGNNIYCFFCRLLLVAVSLLKLLFSRYHDVYMLLQNCSNIKVVVENLHILDSVAFHGVAGIRRLVCISTIWVFLDLVIVLSINWYQQSLDAISIFKYNTYQKSIQMLPRGCHSVIIVWPERNKICFEGQGRDISGIKNNFPHNLYFWCKKNILENVEQCLDFIEMLGRNLW